MPWSGKLVETPVVNDLVRNSTRLRDPKVRFHFHKNSSLVSVLNQIIPVHLTGCFFKFQFNIILLSGFKSPSGLFPLVGHLST